MRGRLGYPRRALRLQECAIAVVSLHGGTVPRTSDELIALPGIGDYTAAAVMSFAYGLRATVLDTNVRRVIARTVSGSAMPTPSPTAAERRLAESLVPHDDSAAALWAVSSMELGALVCTARGPSCLKGRVTECPVADLCAWRAAGHPDDEHAHRRRAQKWTGTDRQVRGRVMAILRDRVGPAHRSMIDASLDDVDPIQTTRCLGALIEDGLIEQVLDEDAYALPA
jgi:A/G-specific adenine glycosylase